MLRDPAAKTLDPLRPILPLSTRTTSLPASLALMAAHAPANPPPMTRTSAVTVFIKGFSFFDFANGKSTEDLLDQRRLLPVKVEKPFHHFVEVISIDRRELKAGLL